MAEPLRRVQIVLHFRWRQHIGADFPGFRIAECSGGIARYQAIPHRLIQTLLEQSVDVPHGVFAQSWVFGTLRAVTAKVFSLLRKSPTCFVVNSSSGISPKPGRMWF